MPDKEMLAESAYSIADVYRSGGYPALAGKPWDQAWDVMLRELKARCPGFAPADYAAALDDGFAASR